MSVAMEGAQIVLRVGAPEPGDKYAPSIDRLFRSAAEAFGPKSVGVVLTGMAGDALEGARAIRNAGGSVVVESSASAVVFGMPGEVAKAGLANVELPLSDIADHLASLM
jgi:two-component system chemotaxis response regulator CheB